MTVLEILDAVKDRGLEGALELTQRYDGVRLNPDDVVWNPMGEAAAVVDADIADAIEYAVSRIEQFHRATLPVNVTIDSDPGIQVSERYVPLSRVGIYIPNGQFPLISTVLMTAVPARVAGVKNIVAAISPRRSVRSNPMWTYVFQRLGISEVLLLGGAQAIGAMAYGIEGMEAVDLIAGPGNRYVTEAKQEVFRRGLVGIDLPAGPSEVMVIANDSALEEFVMADLLAQAEHDVDAQAEFVTENAGLAERIEQRVQALPPGMGKIVVTRVASKTEMVNRANQKAPEHLGLMGADVEQLVDAMWSAGAVFVGPMAGQALGDYIAGPSHVLPTGGSGRFQSGLSSRTFMKRVSIIQAATETSPAPYQKAARLASLEGLAYHEQSMTLRAQTLMERGQV